MTYKVQGISQVIWKFAKSINTWGDNYEDLLRNLSDVIYEYSGVGDIPENEIVKIVAQTFADYAEYSPHGVAKHLTMAMFNQIIGDKIAEMFYGEDTRCLNHKIIIGVLIALRNSQVYDGDKCLIDFGQELK